MEKMNNQALPGFKLNGALRLEDENRIPSSDEDEDAQMEVKRAADSITPSSLLKTWYQNTTDVVVNVITKQKNKNSPNHIADSSSSYTLLVNGDEEEPNDS